MRAPGAVVTDRGRHAVGNILVDYRYRQQAFFPFIDPFGGLEHHVPVVSVHQFVTVVFLVVVADAGHRVAVFPDGKFQQFHFRRSHDVGVVAVRHDFLHWHGTDAVHGALIVVFHHYFQDCPAGPGIFP